MSFVNQNLGGEEISGISKANGIRFMEKPQQRGDIAQQGPVSGLVGEVILPEAGGPREPASTGSTTANTGTRFETVCRVGCL